MGCERRSLDTPTTPDQGGPPDEARGKGVDLAGTTVLDASAKGVRQGWTPLRALPDQIEAAQQGGSHDDPDGPPAPDR
jgi:hypothetical protein